MIGLTKDDLTALFKGLIVAMIGAGLTYVTSWFTSTDFGVYTPLVVAVLSFVVNVIRKWIDGPVLSITGKQI